MSYYELNSAHAEEEEVSDLLTPYEVAKLFGVDSKTVARWATKKPFPLIDFITTPGGHRRFKRESVESFLKRQTVDDKG